MNDNFIYSPLKFVYKGNYFDSIEEFLDCVDGVELDKSGLYDYLRLGFIGFGSTFVKGLSYDRPWALSPISEYDSQNISTKSAFEIFESRVSEFSKFQSVVLPLSGGLDSSLIAYFLKGKSNLEAFTYSVDFDQRDSYELRARDFCRKYNLSWCQVALSDYFSLTDEWVNLFGSSMHAHGMYQLDFYKKIRSNTISRNLISGIIGDALAGSTSKVSIPGKPDELYLYTHGLSLTSEMAKYATGINKSVYAEREYYEKNAYFNTKKKLALYIIRSKMMLLRYLVDLPSSLGFVVDSPFLYSDVAEAFLSIENKFWDNRRWQFDFCKKYSVFPEQLHYRKENTLHNYSILRHKFNPLDIDLFSKVFKKGFLIDLNLVASRSYANFSPSALRFKNAYLILKPLEKFLSKLS